MQQAGTDLGKAQIKLGLGFTSIKFVAKIEIHKILLASLPPTITKYWAQVAKINNPSQFAKLRKATPIHPITCCLSNKLSL